MRAAVAQGRGLAGRRGHFRRGLAGQDAAHPLHVQFAEAVHLRLSLHGDARRAKLLDQEGIALFDNHRAGDAADEAGDLLQRQRPGEPQFQHAGRGGRLAGVHRRHARGDDPQIPVPLDDRIQIAVFAPAGDFRQLLAQAMMGRPGIRRDHHGAGNVALEFAASGSAAAPRGQTTVLLWQTRVVIRSRTGSRQRVESSTAARVKS